MITIKRLTPDLLEDYLDFFDYRAFSDGSPFYPCYCSAYFNHHVGVVFVDFYFEVISN